jgi:hypothetical protein
MIPSNILLQHLKADPHELELAQTYLAQAIGMCEGHCNRRFYATQDDANEDLIVALADMRNLRAWRDAQTDIATEFDFAADRQMIEDNYIIRRAAIKARISGMVVNHAIEGAILKQTGYLFTRRQEGAELPLEVKRILEPYVWPGDLAGSGS